MTPAQALAWKRASLKVLKEEAWMQWELATFLARVLGATSARNPIKT